MVDSIKGTGPSQPSQPVSERQSRSAERAQETDNAPISDEVVISEEAQSVAEASDTARQIRETLQEYYGVNLGLDPDFDAVLDLDENS